MARLLNYCKKSAPLRSAFPFFARKRAMPSNNYKQAALQQKQKVCKAMLAKK